MRCAILLLLILLGGCSLDSGCGNRILEAKPDLEGPLIAYRYIRDCGATTDFSTNVAIGKRGENPAEAQVVFTVDADHGAADMEGNAVWSEMHWTAPRRLSVAYSKQARVFRNDAQARGATIQYRAIERPMLLPVD
jgi:hypothetical protein